MKGSVEGASLIGFLVIEAARRAETLHMDHEALRAWYVPYSSEPLASSLSRVW